MSGPELRIPIFANNNSISLISSRKRAKPTVGKSWFRWVGHHCGTLANKFTASDASDISSTTKVKHNQGQSTTRVRYRITKSRPLKKNRAYSSAIFLIRDLILVLSLLSHFAAILERSEKLSDSSTLLA